MTATAAPSVATTGPTARSTLARTARLTGIAYLGILVTGIFAEFVVRMGMVVEGDAAATAANVADATGLFRAGIAADVLMISLDVGVAVGLYLLLRHAHHGLALLAAALRMVQAAVLGANLLTMATALGAAGGGAPDTGVVLAALEVHSLVYDLGLVFFGMACLVLGHLLVVSRLVPRIVGRGLTATGVVYLVGSFTVLLAPGAAATLDPMYGIAVLAELALAGWLAFRGVDTSTARRAPRVPAAA